jgi:3-oxoacyl-(acyl-carrier-protein) synthase
MRRIVVTGLGAVTPLAAGVEASWSRLLTGRSGIRRLSDDVVGDLPGKIGGVVPSLEEDPDAGFDPNTVFAQRISARSIDSFSSHWRRRKKRLPRRIGKLSRKRLACARLRSLHLLRDISRREVAHFEIAAL